MVTELFCLVGIATLSAAGFMLGLFAVNESRKHAGLILGILLMAGGISNFAASMIAFTVKYLKYIGF